MGLFFSGMRPADPIEAHHEQLFFQGSDAVVYNFVSTLSGEYHPMKTIRILNLSWVMLLLASLSIGEPVQGADKDPESWYLEDYGSLWEESPYEKLAEIKTYYHSSIDLHESEGAIVSVNSSTWAEGLFEEWKAEGWTKSAVSDLQTRRLNASTASFIARWLDWYEGSEETEYSCGWYLADLMEGEWKFTHYASIDCDSHGF